MRSSINQAENIKISGVIKRQCRTPLPWDCLPQQIRSCCSSLVCFCITIIRTEQLLCRRKNNKTRRQFWACVLMTGFVHCTHPQSGRKHYPEIELEKQTGRVMMPHRGEHTGMSILARAHFFLVFFFSLLVLQRAQTGHRNIMRSGEGSYAPDCSLNLLCSYMYDLLETFPLRQ